jgi:urease accessory protein
VLAEMLRAMHLIVSEAQSAFEPESGAYAAADAAHSPAAPLRGKPLGIAVNAAPHVHGPACGHDHGH